MRADRYQIVLVILGFIATVFFAYFFYKELFPEYKIYQDDYVALEEFRSTYTGQPPPEFKVAVKQIVFEREDKGPERIDRCTSCHVAVQLPHFSPTKIEYDINGNIARTADGTPKKVPNEDYVWGKLDQKIAALTDEKVNQQFVQEGNAATVEEHLKEADRLRELKTATVHDHVYDVTKVLAMHPLIGKETRPFEFHSLDEYGCTLCHSGNGRGLTTEKAHGPVFDGDYETEFMGAKPEFTERDIDNDPSFARVFNDKPGHDLLFQTTPILVGNLIQSSCIQCHEQSASALKGLADTAWSLTAQRNKKTKAIEEGFDHEKEALLSLIAIKQLITTQGYAKAVESLKQRESNPSQLPKEREYLSEQITFLQSFAGGDEAKLQASALAAVNAQIISMLGAAPLENALETKLMTSQDKINVLDQFLVEQQSSSAAKGSLFVKWKTINQEQALLNHIQDTQQSLTKAAANESTISALASDIDLLTYNYHRGQELYLSQACYACHRIAGLARGGVGPDLTQAGNTYPWFLKESIVWPQADLRTSTMPNFHLDHVEVEDLMTFLLGQKGPTKAVSQTDYKLAVQEWEAGRRMPWEKPVSPSQIHDLRYSMTVFATQGCAACHRLEGYESNVGYRIEKEAKPDFDALYKKREWFRKLFPEESLGTALVKTIEANAEEIDREIVEGVRQGSILEEIDTENPDTIESFYSNFRYASRAKNHEYQQKEHAEAPLKDWQRRVKRVLMMYVQEYGLGRLVGPRVNWSGVARSDEWLMEHFHNPAQHVPRSIMPVFPFDDSKFYALTYMLDVLGKRNRDAVRKIWEHKGFNPEQAYQLFCSQCHGTYLQGNGPVATWIYPIPKNLRNSEFLHNLTRERAIQSIIHGVKGTPMPAWGEAPQPKPDYDGIPVLTADETSQLVDWLFSSLPGGSFNRDTQDIPKWQYKPEDVLKELKNEGSKLKSGQEYQKRESSETAPKGDLKEESGVGYNRSIESVEQAAAFLAELQKPCEIYYTALQPVVAASQSQPEDNPVAEVFDVLPNLISGGDQYNYYIQKKYYTEENIQKGKEFFELNCAVCHGKEADGAGIRSSVMADAKPRMLTNLDWLHTRDDLRLLRSIKYGVNGTSMTPWGDLTSSLQRIQLVMYIRSLSAEKERRQALFESLYSVFDTALQQVEMVRIRINPPLEVLQADLEAVQQSRKEEYEKAQEGHGSFTPTLELYKKQVALAEKIRKTQELEDRIVQLKGMINKQREIYQNIGTDMISAAVDSVNWDKFLELLKLNEERFVIREGKLTMRPEGKQEKQIQQLANEIGVSFDSEIMKANEAISALNKVSNIEENADKQQSLKNDVIKLSKVKIKLLSGIFEDNDLRQKQITLLKQIESVQKVGAEKSE